jgi:hypothetical protein
MKFRIQGEPSAAIRVAYARAQRIASRACLLLLLPALLAAADDGGFASRDLNPLLQPIYLPTLAGFSRGNGWRVDHSLYITNTLQEEDEGDENLLIDVENYRYELGLRYRRDNWLARMEIPFVNNSAGELDASIDRWHDFFGLPQGKRDEFERDQLNLNYQRNGETIFNQTRSSNGIGDISIAVGYQPGQTWAYFAGIELATGAIEDLSGNEAADIALWLTRQYQLDAETGGFVLLGVSFPGDSDYLQGLIAERIWVVQSGLDYRFNPAVIGTLQFDYHSDSVDRSKLTAFGDSLQIQLGLGFPKLFDEHRLDLFFSEDILVGSAPDISFGMRVSRSYD